MVRYRSHGFDLFRCVATACAPPGTAADAGGANAALSAAGKCPFPPDNPYSEAKEKLGRMLFFDPILSGARNVACASCHNPGLAWADGRKLAAGAGQMELHTPTLIDVAWVPGPGLGRQIPLIGKRGVWAAAQSAQHEQHRTEIISRLTGIPGYVQAFDQAFPGAETEPKITRPHIEQAIATFERTIRRRTRRSIAGCRR